MKTNLGDKAGETGCSQIMEGLECHISIVFSIQNVFRKRKYAKDSLNYLGSFTL